MQGFLAQSISDAFRAFEDARLEDSPTRTPDLERPGTRIGRYDLLEQIGEGGFGTVWRAEQVLPVRRPVALKILKLGMDTCEVIARFEAERQALAVLDHPNIAKVFDAGATPTGRPFFVMELVDGEPITRHCARACVPLAERLALVIAVCHAVQHAHQKGIIHRDLKPSNLLVAKGDGKPVVKIIDFGIAKATGAARLTEHTLVTQAGRLIGTPAYLSPEQAGLGQDVDTRSDVYSLGVVLYELLTGTTPFGSEEWLREFAERPAEGHARDPQRPSARLRSLSPARLEEAAAGQQCEPPRLIAAVTGDLDWIAMKALDRDRTRRFDSPAALAADLERHLRHEPVSARPPTAGYVLRRYAQRHRVAVAAAAAIALVVIAGVAVSTAMVLRQRTALAQSQQVSRFLKKVLSQAGVEKALGRDATMLREILAETAKNLADELRDQPAVEAELRAVIANTYMDLGEYEVGLEQSTAAVRLQRQLHRGDDDDLARALVLQGDAQEQVGKLKEAEASLREALAMRQRLHGDRDVRTAAAHALLAWTLLKSGRPLEGEASARLAVDVWRQHPRDPGLFNAVKSLYAICHNTNRHDESIALMQEELASLRHDYGPEHPDIMNTLDNLGMQFTRVKRFDEAEPLLWESLRQGEKFYRDRNPVAYHIYSGLSKVAASRQDWEQQLQHARASLASAEKVFPPGNRYRREGHDLVAGALLQYAEGLAEAAGKPNPSPGLAAPALAFLEEIAATPELAASTKAAPAWIECLRGATLRKDPANREEATAFLARGLTAMKTKEKPSTEETRRIKKAAAWLAER